MSDLSYILVIEDDPFQQMVIESMIKKCDSIPVKSVSNGLLALQELKQAMPRLVVCDLHMPVMDGVDFLYELSKQIETPPVCILSSVEVEIQRSVLEMANKYGIDNVISVNKPLSVSKIEHALSLIERGLVKSKVKVDKSPLQFSSAELKSAIEQGEVQPFFQPQISSQTESIVSLEALARWVHPKHGLLSPFHFIEQLSEYNLDYELFKCMLSQSVVVASSLRKQGRALNISVNATPSDLLQEGFLPFVVELLKEHDFPTRLLTIEITETQVTKEEAKLLYIVSKLRINGIELAIDDFGTGNSSLSQLISSPFTELKIDLSFVKEMLTSEKHMAAVSSSIMLAKNLKLKTVAEGVETKEQAEKLSELGCDLMQGYYFYKPLSVDQLMTCLDTSTNKPRA
ncbi:EAL domain-containing protein [Vibrio sp. ZSDE26]|uniref:EAL domain-containing protein n=1 Tax=Vibrio amylolyticus TaxID=2847292 RepID=A0A9X2BH25_9VIBR|nr:EAL domain-containing protein [Vibrio amylolyticus]MCK6263464.1 EAL domain-containing protein [Vibrio amylolyticus]